MGGVWEGGGDGPSGVDAKDVGPTFVVGEGELDSSIDTSGTKESGVESVGPARKRG